MKVLIIVMALILTACGDGNEPKTVKSVNTETESTITVVRNLPALDGYTVIKESTDTCLFNGSVYCETRFYALSDCSEAIVLLRMVDNGALWQVRETISMVAGQYVLLQFKEQVKGSISDLSPQSEVSFRCAG